MNCKSCNSSLQTNAKFCHKCGAKIVHNRLSFVGTWQEFIGPFFSWDNNFWRTFIGLFTNPKDVLEAYISGARKKYFQPFSYIIVYASLALFFYKFFPMEFENAFTKGFERGFNSSGSSNSSLVLDVSNISDSLMNFYNLWILLLLPFYAIISYFTFYNKQHNFFEHLVFNSYIQSNFGFLSLLLQILLVNFIGTHFIDFSLITLIIYFSYTFYVFKKLYLLNLKTTTISALKYLTINIITFILIIIISLFVLAFFNSI